MEKLPGAKVVTIGGGTGSFTVLSGLKHYARDLTAIVNMVDDGGSTGILRDELGTLPPGDVRQCLVALSSSPVLMRQLFNYRFTEGTFEGHSFGNLFLSALEKVTGSFTQAVKTAGEILAISGHVIPVTTADVRLGLKSRNHKTIIGERTITQAFLGYSGRPNLFLKPIAKLNPEAKTAILAADLIVIGPGNLYSSIVPTMLVKGMPEALRASKAQKVFVCNLMTKPGQTDKFKVHNFAAEVERYAGKGVFDYVIYNTAKPNLGLLRFYAQAEEKLVTYDKKVLKRQNYQAVGQDLLSAKLHPRDPHDKAREHPLVRHDSDKLARLIMRLYFN